MKAVIGVSMGRPTRSTARTVAAGLETCKLIECAHPLTYSERLSSSVAAPHGAREA